MSIESYNEKQEETPKLTEEQKEEMYHRCQLRAEDAREHISTLGTKDMPEANKLLAAKALKDLFNEGATIMVGHNMMSIDSFCDKLMNGEIDYQSLRQLNTRTRFKEGQFIKVTIPMSDDGTQQTIWKRKIDSMSFTPSYREKKDDISGVEDIKTKKIKEEEQQKLQNSMGKSTAMYNDHEEFRKNDEKDAEAILNSIT